jgi:hypothetical protein
MFRGGAGAGGGGRYRSLRSVKGPIFSRNFLSSSACASNASTETFRPALGCPAPRVASPPVRLMWCSREGNAPAALLHATLAANAKYLARSSKSRAGVLATNRRATAQRGFS